MSRFKIHDDETAPAASVPVLKGLSSTGGQLPNLLGVLGGAPAALRGYVRMRAELRQAHLPPGTAERIGIAVAGAHGAEAELALQERAARRAGIGLDEIRRARQWTSADAAQAALLAWLQPVVERRGPVADHVHEAALEVGWTQEQLLEAIAAAAADVFAAMVDVAGDVPVDGSQEHSRQLRAVA